MTEYNARATITARTPLPDMVDTLAEHHAAAWPAGRNTVDLVVTLPADNLRQATATALALLGQVGTVTSVDVKPTTAFDARNGLAPLPELVSVTDAAAALGVSWQAVLQRLESGSLAGTKVGSTWVIPSGLVRI